MTLHAPTLVEALFRADYVVSLMWPPPHPCQDGMSSDVTEGEVAGSEDSNAGGIVRYHILGSLRVVDGNTVVFINALKIKTVLATLLIRSNRVVPFEQLITELWGERPPRRAVAAVHVYVSQLRKLLRSADGQDSPIITRAPGYLIQVQPDELDLDVFLRLIEQGRRLMREQRHQEIVDLTHTALGMWQEPLLGDLRESSMVNRFATWLEELRIEFIEMMIDSYLILDRHRETVSYLYSLVQEYPLHEKFYRQLMLALHNSGRTADALQVYRCARSTLMVELGVEPGRPLRDLQQLILHADENPPLADSRQWQLIRSNTG
ncbi:AfsR/SARP family transcriptional regulator [Nonomuraea sp. NPDC002799]